MRQPTSGTHLPTTIHVWQNADQSQVPNAAYSPAHFACPGARVNAGVVLVTPRGALPATAGGAQTTIVAFCDADDFLTFRGSNNNIAATAPTGADLTLDLMWIPLAP